MNDREPEMAVLIRSLHLSPMEIGAHIDGLLSAEQSELVAKHLDGCDACRERFSFVREEVERLRASASTDRRQFVQLDASVHALVSAPDRCTSDFVAEGLYPVDLWEAWEADRAEPGRSCIRVSRRDRELVVSLSQFSDVRPDRSRDAPRASLQLAAKRRRSVVRRTAIQPTAPTPILRYEETETVIEILVDAESVYVTVSPAKLEG